VVTANGRAEDESVVGQGVLSPLARLT